MEALLLVSGLTAVSLAMTALFDLLVGSRSWPRKAAWALLVVSLPLVGPVLYYLRAPREPPRPGAARRRSRSSSARPERHDDRPTAGGSDEPAAAAGLVKAEPVDPEHAQPSPDSG